MTDNRAAREIRALYEGTLAESAARLAELRACNNIQAVTVIAATDLGVVAIVVPADNVAEGGGWAMCTEPHLLTIPADMYSH